LEFGEIVRTILVVSVVVAGFLWLIAKRAHFGWGFWLLWVLASAVGLLAGSFVGFLGGYGVEEILPNYGGAGMVTGVGAGVGILQWLVLRPRVSRSGWWVLASILGLAVAGFVSTAVALAGAYEIPLGFAVFGFVGGAMAGLMQWFVLRRQVSRAGWWVLASTVSWAVVGLVAEGMIRRLLTFGVGLAGGVVGLGGVTGLALVWLLRQPIPEA